MRVVYEGSLEVSADGYTHHVYDEETDDSVESAIEALDERVTPLPELTFTLDYPFERPYAGTVRTDAGASLRHIIDAIRAAYQAMYAGTTTEDIPNLDNKLVKGTYGTAVHVIEDLVIESISIDDETGQLEIGIGS